jgi:type I restriction enzyme S subunit
MAALADDFAESDLPWKVDIVDWATTDSVFRTIIEHDRILVQTGAAHVPNGEEAGHNSAPTPL